MRYIPFGQTGSRVSRTGFGCIPIQRISFEESARLLRHAYDNGVTLFDTANAYTTSEERLGIALGSVRDKVFLCTKTFAGSPEKVKANVENSLKMLQTDTIDLLQIHNPPFLPQPGGEDGVYDCLLEARRQGKIRHIGITAHSLRLAQEAVASGLYASLQFPFSYLSSPEELALIEQCREKSMGVLAMKGLGGGLITNAKAAFTFLRQYDNLVPIWGMQKMEELQEFLRYEENPPALDPELQTAMEADREELAGNFCRACGYCLPCPAQIPIPTAARITFLLRRAVRENFITDEWKENMRRIDDCTGCGHCAAHCPYGLDTPALLKSQRKQYGEMVNP